MRVRRCEITAHHARCCYCCCRRRGAIGYCTIGCRNAWFGRHYRREIWAGAHRHWRCCTRRTGILSRRARSITILYLLAEAPESRSPNLIQRITRGERRREPLWLWRGVRVLISWRVRRRIARVSPRELWWLSHLRRRDATFRRDCRNTLIRRRTRWETRSRWWHR